LLDNCASCHRPGRVAPMSLLNYGETRPWARAIQAKVETREMPPWFADPRFGKFLNDSSLSDAEIEAVVAWVDAGAPEGNGAPPAPPQFSDAGWSHPSGLPPDFIYEFPIEWHIEAEGETPNFNLYTPLPFDQPMWVTGTEVHPGNRAVTHHITTGLRNIPTGMKVGTGPVWEGGPTADYVLIPDTDPDREAGDADEFQEVADRFARGEGGEEFSTGFGLYVPGQSMRNVKGGHVQAIRGDLFSHIRWNLHYQATGRPETARPRVGAWTAAAPDHVKLARRQVQVKEYTSEGRTLVAPPPLSEEEAAIFAARFEVNQDLNPLLAPIPPQDANWTVTGIGAFQNDSFLQDIWVHAHTRGKDFTAVLTYPDGREEIVLRLANYSFDWQYRYYFEEPPFAPAGTTLKVIGRYDNSRANRQNPAPHKPAYWSEQSWDDMFVVNAGYTLAEDGEAGDD
ncbi:MAG: cytochrome c, partial [Acidobacteria bacterium]|nr:cytochrome c [Acidobacteriota bacterium]